MCDTLEGAQRMQHDTVHYALDAGMYLHTYWYIQYDVIMYVQVRGLGHFALYPLSLQ